jgi:hypothetical protein
VPVADNTRVSLHRPSARRNESVQLLFWQALHTWIGTLAMLQEVSATHLAAAFEPGPAVLYEHRTTLKIASNIHLQLTLSPRTRYKCKIWCNAHHFAISFAQDDSRLDHLEKNSSIRQRLVVLGFGCTGALQCCTRPQILKLRWLNKVLGGFQRSSLVRVARLQSHVFLLILSNWAVTTWL